MNAGDCWLVSAIALLTEHPDLLRGVFLKKEFNERGVYQLRLCRDGRWQIVFSFIFHAFKMHLNWS